MEETFLYYLSALSFILLLLLPKLLKSSRRKKAKNPPPRPPSLPILGHLHLIREPVQRTLERISRRYGYGPVFSLSFGSRPVVVVSSPEALEECFGKNDIIFADRPQLESWRELTYNFTIMGSAAYGPHWRNLRRISALEILSTTRLNSFLGIRQEEVRFLVKNLHQAVTEQGGVWKVIIRPRLKELTFNVIMRMVSGKRYFGAEVDNSDEAEKFRDIIRDMLELSGEVDPGDFVPMLRWIGLGGQQKRKAKTRRKLDVTLQGLIEEHRNKIEERADRTKTIIELMLDLQLSEPESYSDDIIKGMILTLLAGGTDTSSVTIEWAMSLLLNNPVALEKARAELDNRVGQDRLIDEHDIQCLPYLQNIINETFRLCPAVPLLLPHQSTDDATIQGFDVFRGTMLFVNAWAMHRDPKLWDDPMSFSPERFEGLEHGSYAHKLVPFGLGRRGCPGATLGHKMVAMGLGALIQCFEWGRVGEELVELSEGTGLAMPKARPLEAFYRSRNSNITNTLSQL